MTLPERAESPDYEKSKEPYTFWRVTTIVIYCIIAILILVNFLGVNYWTHGEPQYTTFTNITPLQLENSSYELYWANMNDCRGPCTNFTFININLYLTYNNSITQRQEVEMTSIDNTVSGNLAQELDYINIAFVGMTPYVKGNPYPLNEFFEYDLTQAPGLQQGIQYCEGPSGCIPIVQNYPVNFTWESAGNYFPNMTVYLINGQNFSKVFYDDPVSVQAPVPNTITIEKNAGDSPDQKGLTILVGFSFGTTIEAIFRFARKQGLAQ